MHDGVAPMVEYIETPCYTCIDIADIMKGIKKMATRKATDVTYISSELLKWTRPHTRHWIMTIIEQVIKQCFPNDLLMNWIKSIFKVGNKNQVENMPNHRLPHLAWNVGCELQKNHKSRILSSGWVVDIRKWFRRWGVMIF